MAAFYSLPAAILYTAASRLGLGPGHHVPPTLTTLPFHAFASYFPSFARTQDARTTQTPPILGVPIFHHCRAKPQGACLNNNTAIRYATRTSEIGTPPRSIAGRASDALSLVSPFPRYHPLHHHIIYTTNVCAASLYLSLFFSLKPGGILSPTQTSHSTPFFPLLVLGGILLTARRHFIHCRF